MGRDRRLLDYLTSIQTRNNYSFQHRILHSLYTLRETLKRTINISKSNTYSIEPSSIIHIDSYQASLVPIIALADDRFDDYPNRLAIFSGVTISSGQDGQYLATLPNGSKATLPASAITPDMIAAKSIVCVPRFDRASGGVTLDCAHPTEQPLTLTKK